MTEAPSTDPTVPTLDRSGDVWVGIFPGLGTVEIGSEGEVTVTVEQAPAATGSSDDPPDAAEDAHLREAALRYGWAEGLSWARRGYQLVNGAGVCPPADPERCLVVSGDPHDVSILLIELVKHGWTVMGDKFMPTKWTDQGLEAQPREAPVLMSVRRLQKAELDGTKVRAHTDARAVDLPRADGPRRIVAFCSVRMRKPDDAMFEVLSGTERFEAAAGTKVGGALRPATSDEGAADENANNDADTTTEDLSEAKRTARQAELAAAAMTGDLRMAAIPQVRLGLDSHTAGADAQTLVDWWDDQFGSSREAYV